MEKDGGGESDVHAQSTGGLTQKIGNEGVRAMSTLRKLEHGSPTRSLHTCNFDQIETPGTYVECRTGTLLRVPEDALAPGRSPRIEIVAHEPWTVTRLAEDPYVPLTKARMIAADLDLPVNF
jgi:hypothetical protein